MENNTSSSGQKVQQETIPPPLVGERAVVRCAGFRCLAVHGADGKWRDAKDGKELPEVLEVILRF